MLASLSTVLSRKSERRESRYANLVAARLYVLVLERRVFSFFGRVAVASVRESGHSTSFLACSGSSSVG